MYLGVEVKLHSFLNVALDGDEWVASRPDFFTPEKEPRVPIGYEAGLVPELIQNIKRV
jgi:hypothetical protein